MWYLKIRGMRLSNKKLHKKRQNCLQKCSTGLGSTKKFTFLKLQTTTLIQTLPAVGVWSRGKASASKTGGLCAGIWNNHFDHFHFVKWYHFDFLKWLLFDMLHGSSIRTLWVENSAINLMSFPYPKTTGKSNHFDIFWIQICSGGTVFHSTIHLTVFYSNNLLAVFFSTAIIFLFYFNNAYVSLSFFSFSLLLSSDS